MADDADGSAPHVRRALGAALAGGLLLLLADTVLASNAAVGLGGASGSVNVPRWLYVTTGGAVVGASALLASLVTDRAFIRALHGWRASRHVRLPGRRHGRAAGRLLGVVALALTVFVGLTGPQIPTVNFAVLFVFVGVRAGLTMVSYLVGNVWPALNPWRAVAELLPTGFRDYPDRWGRWPAVAGFLALVWVETATPVTDRPATLALAVLGYSLFTVAGAVAFGPDDWFGRADPVSAMFEFYGAVSPLRRTPDGLTFQLPGSDLIDGDVVTGLDDVAFVVALVWELTFSGFVTTAAGNRFFGAVDGLGIPGPVAYFAAFVGGYAAFAGAYWLAARLARRTGPTYLAVRVLALRFAPALLGIAAGYHLAHYFAFFVSLSPSLGAVLANPLSPPANPVVLSLPSWFGGLNVAFVLLGHVLGIWVSHAVSYESFPGRIQAVRTQYPFVAVMILYTAASLWLISLPTEAAAYL